MVVYMKKTDPTSPGREWAGEEERKIWKQLLSYLCTSPSGAGLSVGGGQPRQGRPRGHLPLQATF